MDEIVPPKKPRAPRAPKVVGIARPATAPERAIAAPAARPEPIVPKLVRAGQSAADQTTAEVPAAPIGKAPAPVVKAPIVTAETGPIVPPAPPATAPAASKITRPTPAPSKPVMAEPVPPAPVQPEPEIVAVASPAVESDPTPAEPERLAAQTEDMTKMATISTDTATATAAEGADKMQAIYGDMSARFKAALEKSQKLGEELVELTKGNIEAMVASARVAAKGGETIGQEVGDYSRKSIEGAIAAMKGFASVKSPTELFQLQSDYLKTSFDAAVAEASKLSESMLKIAGDAAQPLSSRYAVAAEKFKSAAL